MKVSDKKICVAKVAGLFFAGLFLFTLNLQAGEWNGIRLTPYVNVTEIYDDNVTFRKNDPIDDFITTLSGGLSAFYETPLAKFQLDGALRYDLFAENDEFNNASGDVTADWKQEITRYDRIHFRDSYLRSDEARSFTDAFNKSAGRFGYQKNNFSVDYAHDFTSQWGGTLNYVNEFTIYSTDLFNDSYMNSAGVGAVYHMSSMTHFLFNYDFKIREFESDLEATTNSLSTGVRHYLTKQLYFDGRVGADFIDAYNNDDMTEPFFQAKLTDDIDERTSIDVGFEQQHSLNSFTEDVFDHWQISSSIRRELTRRLKAAIAFFYGEGEYVASQRQDELIGANASLAYDFTQNWQGIIRYTFTNLDSTQELQEYRKNVVFLGLTFKF